MMLLMMMLKRLYNELVKKVNAIQTTDTSNLVKKTEYNTKIGEIEKKMLNHDHDQYITTQEFINLTSDHFDARLKQSKLATKHDIADFVRKAHFDKKLIDVNRKITLNKTRHGEVKNKLDDLSQKSLGDIKERINKRFDK